MTATINLLSGNQASIEGGVSDFTSFVGTGGSISRDLSTSVFGNASLKVVLDGVSNFQFVTAQVLAATWLPGTQYTSSFYIKSDAASAGKTLRYFVDSSAGAPSSVQTLTLTTSWTRYSVTFTTPNPITATWLGPRIDTGSTAHAVTCWMDCLQVNTGGLMPWVPGGNGANPLAYMSYIGGMPAQLVAGSLHVENAIGQRSTGGVNVWSGLGIAWQYGTQIQVYDDTSALVYTGFVSKDKASKAGARQGAGFLEHSLTLMDNSYRADKRVIFASYLSTSAGTIVKDIIGKVLAAEGVTFTSASIATGATITEVIWNGKQTSAALAWLASQSGYWWAIDLNNVLWFQPYGGVPAPFVLDGTQVDAMNSLSVEYGNDMYVNTQYAKGAYAEKKGLSETFHGDGVRRNFTLSYQVSKITSVTLNSVDVTVNTLTKGSNGGQFYYATGDAVLAQDTSQTLLTSGDTLVVNYNGRYPVLAVAKNPTLVNAQASREGTGSGIVESVYVNTKVRSLSAAFQIASAVLSHYGSDTTVLTFLTRQKGLMQGQMLTVNLSDFSGLSNKQMLISGVTIADNVDGYTIWYSVTAVGSPIEPAQWQTYWQNLMNQSSDPSDLSDVADTSLASLFDTVLARTPVFVVTPTHAVCALCSTSGMICGQWTVC